MSKLALFNSRDKIRTKNFPQRKGVKFHRIHKEMKEIFDKNKFSEFRGNWSQSFYGGMWVRELEKYFENTLNVKHAVAVNSATSGLQIACHAVGVRSGDQVIVTPWSMSCSATAPLACGATPVFVDVEKNFFCLDVPANEFIKGRITDKTKAIIAVDLFGQGFHPAIKKFAKEKGIFIIEDAAQAIGAISLNEKGEKAFAGVVGDIGVYSFTQGKHISAGEGGMCVTDDDNLAHRLRLLRNHTDAVNGAILQKNRAHNRLSKKKFYPLGASDSLLFGYNMRMTELNALIALEASKEFFERRERENIISRAKTLRDVISEAIPFIEAPPERFLFPNYEDAQGHSYYVTAFLYSQEEAEVHRDIFIEAVKAELSGEEGRPDKGVPINAGYTMPLHKLPLFYPNSYELPVVDRLQKDELFLTTLPLLPLTTYDLQNIVDAFVKVYENINELRGL